MKKFKPFNLEDVSKEELYENLQRCISEKIIYWNRINKAIEYIKEKENENEYGSLEENEKIILNILRGVDNENNN